MAEPYFLLYEVSAYLYIYIYIYIVGPKGSKGFGPFHFKPKGYTKEEEVPEDE